MRRALSFLALLGALAFSPAPALAWSNHGLLTYWAFKDTPEVGQAPDRCGAEASAAPCTWCRLYDGSGRGLLYPDLLDLVRARSAQLIEILPCDR